MSSAVLNEDFDQEPFDERLRWHCPPSRWSVGASSLILHPNAETDFWQRTHYGFSADNGHFLGLPMEGDFTLSTTVRFFPVHQYDQAGLMVRYSPECWLKTSVEYEPGGGGRLGAVVTQRGFSDWSTQDFPAGGDGLDLRVRKVGNDFTVEHRETSISETTGSVGWTQMRLAHLERPAGASLQVGLYACSPKGAGFRAEFDWMRLTVTAD